MQPPPRETGRVLDEAIMSVPLTQGTSTMINPDTATSLSGLDQEDRSECLDRLKSDKLHSLPVKLPQVPIATLPQASERVRAKTRTTHSATISRSPAMATSLPRQRRHPTMSKILQVQHGANWGPNRPTRPGDAGATNAKQGTTSRLQQVPGHVDDKPSTQQRHRAEVYAINARMRAFSQDQLASYVKSQGGRSTLHVSPMGV
ncbi:hypothetical protein H257_11725 [Aphanomyces astaci]|uniref:Uncharacterized protein n=1 Tax=Aphanomyces astaci TaxID=112090 RepID=W4G3K9_APHAT|nr:hypothetical protein H257_11725 [Aphanomyces astaci]ETV73609.1 hypothetical protein H257_11725 [Aphanomyces astaci]|eukprot:XP_009837035.1 hypothetical protein H257_11725 [Aphanomyces astaci]